MRLICTLQQWCRDRAISLSALLLLSTGLMYKTKPQFLLVKCTLCARCAGTPPKSGQAPTCDVF